MNAVTLRQLRYFEALAKHGNFGRAASACAVSQPALSVQIKELEQALQVQLFERGSRQVQLTAFGQEWALQVRQVLQGVDELAEMARAAQQGLSGPLRIGVIPTIAPYLLPRLLARLNDNCPDLDCQIRESVTPRLLEELASGRIDAAIVALPVAGDGFAQRPLFAEHFVLVRPEGEKDNPVPAPRALAGARLLMLEEGHCFRDQAMALCSLPPADARSGLEGSSLSTLVQMVGAGLGVTLIPQMAVGVEARAAPVCVDRLGGDDPKRTVGMVWRKTTPLADHLQIVAEEVRTVGAEIGLDVDLSGA
ncbi:MAG: LysR substrate-binding domain-containing protein [Pseudomonadota bacterium]